MKCIKTQDAVGQILCHDITQIIKGVTKDALFLKGHVITESDIPILLSLGKDHLHIWEESENLLHENDAAEILRKLCQNENMHPVGPKEGKIDLIADMDGLFLADIERMRMVNNLGEIMIATRASGFAVKKGDKLCGTRVVPLAIEKERMERACQVAGNEPLLKLLPIKPKKYGLVTTGNEVFHGRIKDTFTPVIQEKLDEYGCTMVAHEILDDDNEKITSSIKSMLAMGAEIALCTGGMSVDSDDRTPTAIKNAAVTVVSYGAPVLPGAMFMLAYTSDGKPVCGLPGCVMYAKRTIFDLVLPRLLADAPVTTEWLGGLGNGGLCLGCPICHFPNCSFGKGV
ncbi:MAG: molybdopterin-binding protein [Dehalococcoidia bacterium]|nr:molybdopterin-binding protein [Dehalococcoidia bacterium]